MKIPECRALIIQTAFPGDVVLTLPLAQQLKTALPGVRITFVATPAAAGLLENHPSIDEVILFDKKGADAGWRGMRRTARRIREQRCDIAYIPHRSLRSALLAALARIPRRIGFDRSAGRWFLTESVRYDRSLHEIERNLSLLAGGGSSVLPPRPALFPSARDVEAVDHLLRQWRSAGGWTGRMIGVAPGSVWATKRWPAERFAAAAALLIARGYAVVLLGSREDAPLCGRIESEVRSRGCLNAAGKLSLLQSAELIRRCEVLLSNDSAPVHLAAGVRTPVVAIFGPTSPGFGFAPRGPADEILETNGLSCRPCAIHGGTTCPTGTFECMLSIPPDRAADQVETIIHAPHSHG